MITQDRYNVAYILTEQSDDRPLREEFRKKLTEHRTYSVKKTIDYERSSLIPALLYKGVFAEFMASSVGLAESRTPTCTAVKIMY